MDSLPSHHTVTKGGAVSRVVFTAPSIFNDIPNEDLRSVFNSFTPLRRSFIGSEGSRSLSYGVGELSFSKTVGATVKRRPYIYSCPVGSWFRRRPPPTGVQVQDIEKMKPTDQDIVKAHQERLARRRAKRKADIDYFHAREAAWRRSESGKASLARKRAKDAERAKQKQREYETALQKVTATPATEQPATTRESLEALRQEVLNRFRQLLENYFRLLVTITEQA